MFSFVTVVISLFGGLLLTQYDTFNASIKVPLSFFIVSLTALLISTLMLANSSEDILEGNEKKVRKHLAFGYAISEYLGIYPLLIALPMSILVITSDVYLRVIVVLVAVAGMATYHYSGLSLLEKHFPKARHPITVISIVLLLAMIISQWLQSYQVFVASITLIILTIFVVQALRNIFAQNAKKEASNSR
jgi:hypothetical protein